MMSPELLLLINQLALYFPVFLIVFTTRGFFKALVASLMGDNTARNQGFLTLNPLMHVDIVGVSTLFVLFFFSSWLLGAGVPRSMMVFVIVAFGGLRWTFQVPVNDENFKHFRLGGIATSLAGSFGNLFLAFATVLIAKFLVFEGMPRYAFVTLIDFLKNMIDIALWFGILELIPLPPFDAGKLWKYLLPQSQRSVYYWLKEYSFFILIMVFFMPGVSDLVWNFLHLINIFAKKIMFGFLF